MTEQQFAYWLQGFAELSGESPPTREQWKSIQEHLATVFVKVTPVVQQPMLRQNQLGLAGYQQQQNALGLQSENIC